MIIKTIYRLNLIKILFYKNIFNFIYIIYIFILLKKI